ncbi:MAG TPA: ion transporter, partial [Oceanospirillales bacterium]|nr:ion transporter [Oceanospirillales bacterium]
MPEEKSHRKNWRSKIFKIIYHADTPAGKWFDLLLIIFIVLSVLTIILDSVGQLHVSYGHLFYILEWFFTIVFTFEFIIRLISIRRPLRYVFSFFGVVDILSILPTYLSLFFIGAQHLLVIRILRILRVFRILKLVRYTAEAQMLTKALSNSRHKIFVFFFFIITVLIIFGSIMYLVEGPNHGFNSIPAGIYWAVVTLTTVGYGDIAPQTVFGRMIASLIMLTGYSIIAVPTGIFAAEFNKETKRIRDNARICSTCNLKGHTRNAVYCRRCG